MSPDLSAAYEGLKAVLVTVPIAVVVAMFSAAIMHGVGKAVVALGFGKLDEMPAPAQGLVDDQAAIAVAIAAAKHYQDAR